jgi:hypothetical protein
MNAFAGFTGSTTWNFETADTSFLPSLTGTYAT